MGNVHHYRDCIEIVIWEHEEDLLIVKDGLIEMHITQGALLGENGYCVLLEALGQAARLCLDQQKAKAPSEFYPERYNWDCL